MPAEDEVAYDQSSVRYAFNNTLYGPAPARLALDTFTSQLTLAVPVGLLVGYIVWLATANRMSLSWQISYGITANEFMVYCQPLINANSG